MKNIIQTIACPTLLLLFIASCSMSERAKPYSKRYRAQFRLAHIRDYAEDNMCSADVFSLIYEDSSHSQHGNNNGMIIERRGDAIYISTFVD